VPQCQQEAKIPGPWLLLVLPGRGLLLVLLLLSTLAACGHGVPPGPIHHVYNYVMVPHVHPEVLDFDSMSQGLAVPNWADVLTGSDYETAIE